MNTVEGLNRIALVIRWIGYALAALMVVVAVYADKGGPTWFVLGIGVLFGASGWVLAWIVEGFAKPKL